jgi:soluble lytic murein transglycosylase-like protein
VVSAGVMLVAAYSIHPAAAADGNVPSASAIQAAAPTGPNLLSADDVGRYQAILAFQDQGSWAAADAQIAALDDRVLLGTVLAQRYLSKSYKAGFEELRDWLASYADLPDARAIWQLARAKSAGKPMPEPQRADAGNAAPTSSAGYRLPAEPQVVGLHQPPRFAAGLAAWKLGHYDEAAGHFEAVARAGSTPSWYEAAAAFWAARAQLQLRHPDQADALFALAAQQPRTFYGLLARHTLGLEPDVKSGPQPLTAEENAQLQALPAGRRALALVQIGETDRAEAELKALSARGNRGLANAIVALADLANMPGLCMSLGQQTTDVIRHDEATYPVPRWQPREGYSVDRALLFALMMQESGFNASARGGGGAAGLMQLMPGTARAVAQRAGIKLKSIADLVDPELNLSLGQEYVKLLLDHSDVNGNLILLLAAYNEGPAAGAKWRNQATYRDDPLLLLESLPRQDTRLYVERVMTIMWIYRQRLGQPAPDLEALASNAWPTYVAVDRQAAGAQTYAASR